MAKTIAKAKGNDYSRTKEVHRLGSESSEGQANTWRTFVTAFVRKDGSGFVEVARDGQELHYFKFEAEEPLSTSRTSKQGRKQTIQDVALYWAIKEAERQAKGEAESDDDREIKKTWTDPDALDEANEDVKDMSNEELKIRKDELERLLQAEDEQEAEWQKEKQRRFEEKNKRNR